MKNKHTLANKKKLDAKAVSLMDRTDEYLTAARGFGKSQTLFDNVTITLKWWQKLLNKITFGLYKPTTFWYKVKPIKK